jgi:protein CpxP
MKRQTKKIILSLGAIALFTTSLSANTYEGKRQLPNGMMIKHYQMKQMPMKGYHKKSRKNMIISKIMMLDLTPEQSKKIKEIVEVKNDKVIDPLDAFSENGFDKDKYIKAIEGNKEARLKERAEKISKIYALLTKEQKKDLKTIIDMEKLMKKKKFDRMMGKNDQRPQFRG